MLPGEGETWEGMVQLIELRGIRNPRVLDAFRMVPREFFVPEPLRAHAYEDRPLEIGLGQTISQPYMVALMTELLDPTQRDRVLEVGTGSGYQAAVLSLLAKEVVTIERHEALAEAARERLYEFGCRNVEVIVADGSLGYAARAPYDGIVVTAASPHVPAPLIAQLAEGGRLVCPVGPRTNQALVYGIKTGGEFHPDYGIGCVFVPLLGEAGWQPELPAS